MNESRIKPEWREREREREQIWGNWTEREGEGLHLPQSPFDLCLSVLLRLLEYEPVPNIVLNIQPGANHLGPEDFEEILQEVTHSPSNRDIR